jgi:hypothetical protein
MRPKRQIIAGWATGLVAVAAGAMAIPAAADKVSSQRVEVVMTQTAADFRNMPDPVTDSVSIRRLTDLYGPDSLGETPLQRVNYDLGAIDQDTAALREQSTLMMQEADCLANAVYYEARSETRSGQVAVAQVIQNRVYSKHFPNSICGVVFQGSERITGCQFSFTCDGSMDRAPKGKSWDRSKNVARYVLSESPRSLVGPSTHYHTTYIDPHWSGSLKKTAQVGSHIFYRFPFRERRVTSSSVRVAPPT